MRINPGSHNPEAIAKRMFWLAYQAAGVRGSGVLQSRDSITESDVWNNVCNAGDYCINFNSTPGKAYGDYVFGRMMKLVVRYGEFIEIQDGTPHPEYQSWCRRYASYESLASAAIESLEAELVTNQESEACPR